MSPASVSHIARTEHRPVAGRGGPGVRTPPEPFTITFPTRVNPVSFHKGGGRGRAVRVRSMAAIEGAPKEMWLK